MQGFSSTASWTPPRGTLGELTQAAHIRAVALASQRESLEAAAMARHAGVPFAAALRSGTVQVIAEVKRASPSKGAIAPGLDAAEQAAHYVAGGAAAISVLTEPTRFGGALIDLADVAQRVAVPVIRKDFIVDAVQLWEARAAGASAALLIVRALSPEALPALVAAGQGCGLELIVEIRDLHELARALDAGAQVIGVNNRDLETLRIDPATAPSIIPHIPARCIAVAESGMRERRDVEPAAAAGADALLVGSAVSAAGDAAAAVRALSGVPRRDRAA